MFFLKTFPNIIDITNQNRLNRCLGIFDLEAYLILYLRLMWGLIFPKTTS